MKWANSVMKSHCGFEMRFSWTPPAPYAPAPPAAKSTVGKGVLLPRPFVTPRYVSSDSHFGPVGELMLPVQMHGVDACPPLLDSLATTFSRPSIMMRLFLKLDPYGVASSRGWSDAVAPLMPNPAVRRQSSAGRS